MLQRLAQFRVALLDLLEQPHVFDGDHRLIGEGLEKSDLLFRKRPNFGSADLNRADGNSLTKQRRNKNSARASNLLTGLGFRELRLKLWHNIMNVNRSAVDDRSAGGCAASEGPSASRHRHLSMHRYMLKDITIDAINQNVARIAQPCGSSRDRVEHWLNVGRRAGDDTQDFTRRSLLLQRFLEFLEQPDVLECDDRLVSEGLEEL